MVLTDFAANLIANYTGALLQHLIGLLLDITIPKLKTYFEKTELNNERLQELKTLLLTVYKVLADAEEKQITNNSFRKWLQKVSQIEDAAEANLKDKKYIHELIFEWSDVELLLDQNGDAHAPADDPCNNNESTGTVAVIME
ncbi:hypothetical protein CCACVL1_16085 [Corchorus capsularis]|uniref:Disease resistance N-terminal domain-containing protein n=1 Tax=Corchorus capsularis TaxID=210143 RepID=A0A1R3HZ90_COCAP|nr:hypothetical protein CCACVL1_16085 [Corchorus capsularis]